MKLFKKFGKNKSNKKSKDVNKVLDTNITANDNNNSRKNWFMRSIPQRLMFWKTTKPKNTEHKTSVNTLKDRNTSQNNITDKDSNVNPNSRIKVCDDSKQSKPMINTRRSDLEMQSSDRRTRKGHPKSGCFRCLMFWKKQRKLVNETQVLENVENAFRDRIPETDCTSDSATPEIISDNKLDTNSGDQKSEILESFKDFWGYIECCDQQKLESMSTVSEEKSYQSEKALVLIDITEQSLNQVMVRNNISSSKGVNELNKSDNKLDLSSGDQKSEILESFKDFWEYIESSEQLKHRWLESMATVRDEKSDQSDEAVLSIDITEQVLNQEMVRNNISNSEVVNEINKSVDKIKGSDTQNFSANNSRQELKVGIHSEKQCQPQEVIANRPKVVTLVEEKIIASKFETKNPLQVVPEVIIPNVKPLEQKKEEKLELKKQRNRGLEKLLKQCKQIKCQWTQLNDQYIPYDPNKGLLTKEEVITMEKHGIKLEQHICSGAFGSIHKIKVTKRESLENQTHVKVMFFAAKILSLNFWRNGELLSVKTAVEKLLFEAKVHSDLIHPNIVDLRYVYAIHDSKIKSVPIRLCQVMELCDGDLLKELQISKMDEKTAGIWFSQIASAVKYLHDNHIVHMDIKPQNILHITQANGSKVYKLTDFGLSFKFGPKEDMKSDQYYGTEGYMAPEIVCRKPCFETKPTDIYSLGISLGQSITAEQQNIVVQYFKIGKSLDHLIRRLYKKGFSPDVIELISRMISDEPNHRPTIDEVLDSEWILTNT